MKIATIHLKPEIGDTAEKLLVKALNLARNKRCWVEFEINGTLYHVSWVDTPKSLSDKYFKIPNL